MDQDATVDHPAWPMRAVLLAGLGALFGLLFETLTGPNSPRWADDPLRVAAGSFLAVSGIVLAFSLERRRWTWSVAFAAAAGLVAAFVTWWNGNPNDWGAGEGWQLFSGVLAAAIAVPLFQAVRDSGGGRPRIPDFHANVWTNLILGAAAVAFVLATFLLTLLLAELFHLIGIDFLRDLLRGEWFGWVLGCGALGGAIGLLRDRDQVLGTLQRVVRAILSVLTPILALGLLLFVGALPFTGLQPLWAQTQATTPILLVCVLGAVLLANAALGNGPEEESRSRVLRWSAMGLVAVMAPLAAVAAVSTGKRIGQYGLTPDRLWAVVFVGIAVAFGLFYLHALVRGRSRWADELRRANVRLAAGLCLLALFLALPIVSFGAISARDQLARLESGKVAPERFDWAAMRFDFGPRGRHVIERLARSENSVIRQRARDALRARDRWALGTSGEVPEPAAPPPAKLRVDSNVTVPPSLTDLIGRTHQCYDELCRLVFVGPRQAVLLRRSCPTCAYVFEAQPDGTWLQHIPGPPIVSVPAPDKALVQAVESGPVEVRKVERRQVFVGGRPVGRPFE